MSEWKCTGECRYRQKPADGWTTYERVLQQLWENVEMASQDWLPSQYQEWRDVPTVEEPEQ